MRRGPKSKKDTVDVDMLKRIVSLGLTNPQLAYVFDVSTTSIERWEKDKPEIRGAIRQGKEVADKRVERALFERAVGYNHPSEKIFCHNGKIIRADYTEHYPPDVTACIHWLKVRRPDEWREINELIVKSYLHFENEGRTVDELKQEAEEIANRIVERRTTASKN